ncbi:disheveled-associated activator of morphogenesis 1 isoform X1 [Acyrthosiphon pisum]|uniref:Disheveled-associated activator of morphogenesis 1 n=2 Tax=Acyrthosiphon pisum TaxID=7029 RepID=A0A8R1W0Q9_ACYPI|nr:disheveled-associated activator of morphogenesis 1 isoform X1 [Acyrthosiphon pisum]|eukprot:XP_001947056.2 PREDICTED: disheveled-associated activator of morphogenesis 1 isoform X1 [Acyrthosiphon pisum]
MKLIKMTVPRSMAGLAERLSGMMPTPSVRGRKGWCGCLKDDEPPEITYIVVDSGTLTLQKMTPTLPMPEKPELDRLFAELVEELDLTATNKAAMLELHEEKKWQIYCSKKKILEDQENTTDLSQSPENYIERIQSLIGDEQENTKLFDSLKTALRTQPHSFVLRFVQADGLVTLLGVLSSMNYDTQQGAMHTSIIGCIKALMNNSTGRSHVLAHPSAISTIARSLLTENPRTKVAVLEILGASCLVPGGHKKVLDAMTDYKEFAHERARFQGIINDLDRNTGIYRDDLTVKTAIMSFVNAVLSYGPGQESLEFRLHLRYEFLQLGLKNIINKLREHENQTLDRHMDFFDMVRNEDENELARKFEQEQVDTQSATSMFELLRRKLSHSPAYPHFLSLFQHFLLLPLEYGSLPQHWLLFDRIVQQITLQTDVGADNDVSPININVKDIIQLLAKEEELVAAKNKAEELEKENTSISASLAKKEQELDLRNQEKEDMEASISRIKERLEKEISIHLETKQKISELEDTSSELQHRIAYEQAERRKLEAMLTNGSLPDDAKVNFSAPPMSIPPPPPPQPMTKSCGPAPPPAPPLQIPQLNLPPPPGCLPQLVGRQRSVEIPKPSAPLKSFNWAKLPETKVAGTVWADIDEGKMYSSIDLEAVDKLFCAYQNQKPTNGTTTAINEGSSEDLRQTGKNKSKVLSVIDGRRAQNCTILLSKLKMSDEEIARVIMDMDTKDVLPLDMVEQLLKFTPGPDEAALLEEHSFDLDSLARADRFLYEISKIAHYDQRLRSLVYKKKFITWTGEVEGRTKIVMEASREVARSRRLRKLLEIVLALGNYMNKGARGNAWGFRLSSLNRLTDTKSSSVRGITLLHYIVDMADKKFKDILLLEEDLPHVRGASKVSLAELEKDMSQLRNNLKEVEREIEFQRVQPAVPGDMFLPVMKEFLTTATCKFSELEDLFQDMKTRFDRAVRLFGEDNSTIQPDDFFAIFDSFLTALYEARQDNSSVKKRREEEEKRLRQEVELKKLTLDRKNCKDSASVLSNGSGGRQVSINGTSGDKAEFDDLISALRTGDVFGEDSMAKIKRSRKSRHSPPAREHSRDRVLNVTRKK